MPQTSVLTSTCPAAGLGSGSVSTTISPFLKMAARIGDPFPFRLCRPYSQSCGGIHEGMNLDPVLERQGRFRTVRLESCRPALYNLCMYFFLTTLARPAGGGLL